MLNVTENKPNAACSYTKTDRCMNEFDWSVMDRHTFWTGAGKGGGHDL